MKPNAHRSLETKRVVDGPYGSTTLDGNNGAFFVRAPSGRYLKLLVSDGRDWEESHLPGAPWEHVSVSPVEDGPTPTWEEMDYVKGLWWGDDELVLQFHVPVSVKINRHNTCLHLWRPTGQAIELPPICCV